MRMCVCARIVCLCQNCVIYHWDEENTYLLTFLERQYSSYKNTEPHFSSLF